MDFEGGDDRGGDEGSPYNDRSTKKLYRKKDKHTGKKGPFLNDSGFFFDYNKPEVSSFRTASAFGTTT